MLRQTMERWETLAGRTTVESWTLTSEARVNSSVELISSSSQYAEFKED